MDVDRSRSVSEVFTRWAEAGRAEGMEEGHKLTAARVLDRLALGRSTRLVDLGTGNGWACRFAAERGAHALGLDVAPGMLARAQATSGEHTAFVRASFEAMPFADGVFDLAWSMEALYYADDLYGALTEVVRVLREGGELHALIDFYEENEESHAWPDSVGLDMHLLSEDGWAEALETAGFEDVATERVRGEEGRGDAWKWEVGSLYVRGVRAEEPVDED